jgi:hypothetical protein
MPPSFLLVGCVDRLFAVQLRALEDTVSLLVALEAKPLLFVSFTLMRGQSYNDGVDINSASVWRISATASTIINKRLCTQLINVALD